MKHYLIVGMMQGANAVLKRIPKTNAVLQKLPKTSAVVSGLLITYEVGNVIGILPPLTVDLQTILNVKPETESLILSAGNVKPETESLILSAGNVKPETESLILPVKPETESINIEEKKTIPSARMRGFPKITEILPSNNNDIRFPKPLAPLDTIKGVAKVNEGELVDLSIESSIPCPADADPADNNLHPEKRTIPMDVRDTTKEIISSGVEEVAQTATEATKDVLSPQDTIDTIPLGKETDDPVTLLKLGKITPATCMKLILKKSKILVLKK